MRSMVWAVIVVSLCGGCTSTALERYTLNQSLSVTEMRYQQVMNDLAKVAHNAGTLPGFALTASGVANVTNTLSIDSATLWDQAVKGFSKETLTPFAQHNPELQWTLDPAVSEPQLEAFRYACLWVLQGPPPEGSRAMELLREPRLTDINVWVTSQGGNLPSSIVGEFPAAPPAPAAPAPPAAPAAPPAPAAPNPIPGPAPGNTPVPPAPGAAGPFARATGSPRAATNQVSGTTHAKRTARASDVQLASYADSPAAPSPLPKFVPPDPLPHLGVARQLAALPRCWLHITPNHQVPKHVAYRATRGGISVWVTAEGMAGLSQFTLIMLDIATTDPTKLQPAYPKVTVNITEATDPKDPLASGQASPSSQATNASTTLAAIKDDENRPAPVFGNTKPKEGDKITEVWDGGQNLVIPDPNCANPAEVKPIGTIWLSRPGTFQHMSSATPCVRLGQGSAPAGTTGQVSPRSANTNLTPSDVSR